MRSQRHPDLRRGVVPRTLLGGLQPQPSDAGSLGQPARTMPFSREQGLSQWKQLALKDKSGKARGPVQQPLRNRQPREKTPWPDLEDVRPCHPCPTLTQGAAALRPRGPGLPRLQEGPACPPHGEGKSGQT